MDGKRFIHSIRLQNFLSFGPDTVELPLEPLNVLIGPNASGKSNLIQALSLLKAAPRDIQLPIREGGGVEEWIWKGLKQLGEATIDITVDCAFSKGPLVHRLTFTESFGEGIFIPQEIVVNARSATGNGSLIRHYYNVDGKAILYAQGSTDSTSGDQGDSGETPGQEARFKREISRDQFDFGQSILSQVRDNFSYPELAFLSYYYEDISFYRGWNLGRLSPIRQPQRTDLPKKALLEDASNLGVILSDLLNRPEVRSRILHGLRTCYPPVEDVRIDVTGGLVRIFLHEVGLYHPVPAEQLSDGALRYLCLLAALCHPEPPRVICLEEPELGLHPDMIPELAKLLMEASSRTQLFVTTHSDILVDALSDVPEVIIVCEKLDGASQLRRLNAKELKPWLEKYRLGELWTSGHIGGNRW